MRGRIFVADVVVVVNVVVVVVVVVRGQECNDQEFFSLASSDRSYYAAE